MDIQKQIEKYIFFPDISKRQKKSQGIIKLVTTIKGAHQCPNQKNSRKKSKKK